MQDDNKYKTIYIDDSDQQDDEINIRETQCGVCGHGFTKQELLMEEIQKQHVALYQGLGGSFDVYTGAVKRAPKWWVKNNLEWAYRLIKEPTRIKRQIHLVRFFILLQLGQF